MTTRRSPSLSKRLFLTAAVGEPIEQRRDLKRPGRRSKTRGNHSEPPAASSGAISEPDQQVDPDGSHDGNVRLGIL